MNVLKIYFQNEFIRRAGSNSNASKFTKIISTVVTLGLDKSDNIVQLIIFNNIEKLPKMSTFKLIHSRNM